MRKHRTAMKAFKISMSSQTSFRIGQIWEICRSLNCLPLWVSSNCPIFAKISWPNKIESFLWSITWIFRGTVLLIHRNLTKSYRQDENRNTSLTCTWLIWEVRQSLRAVKILWAPRILQSGSPVPNRSIVNRATTNWWTWWVTRMTGSRFKHKTPIKSWRIYREIKFSRNWVMKRSWWIWNPISNMVVIRSSKIIKDRKLCLGNFLRRTMSSYRQITADFSSGTMSLTRIGCTRWDQIKAISKIKEIRKID